MFSSKVNISNNKDVCVTVFVFYTQICNINLRVIVFRVMAKLFLIYARLNQCCTLLLCWVGTTQIFEQVIMISEGTQETTLCRGSSNT